VKVLKRQTDAQGLEVQLGVLAFDVLNEPALLGTGEELGADGVLGQQNVIPALRNADGRGQPGEVGQRV
jgi:hypothetical protein